MAGEFNGDASDTFTVRRATPPSSAKRSPAERKHSGAAPKGQCISMPGRSQALEGSTQGAIP